jgi:hypothetical protein
MDEMTGSIQDSEAGKWEKCFVKVAIGVQGTMVVLEGHQ